jgi:mono/diheme cytochrome c family protein
MAGSTRSFRRAIALGALALFAALAGCVRERPSSKPPIHLIPDMDAQPKFKAQSESGYFSDGAAMRVPPAGTVARGMLRDDDVYYRGFRSDGTPVKTMPVPVTAALLARGQERFNIYCSPCHSRAGDGRGIMVSRGYVPPPTFHDDRLRNIEDGHIFDVITNGLRNMPSYRYQVPVDDRWAIVAYLRALQRSQNATLDDIPPERRQDVK